MTLPLPNLDDRTYADLLDEARSLIPGEYPAWTDHNPSDSGIILLELFAWLTELMLYRVNQIPDRNIDSFLKLLNGDVDFSSANDLQAAVRDTVLELRRRYRAVTADDFEQLALHDWHTTAAAQQLGEMGRIRRVRCLPQVNLAASEPSFRQLAPGHISLVVLPTAHAAESALTFTQLEDRVELPPVSIELQRFTVAFWVKLTHSMANQRLVSAVRQTNDQPGQLGDWWFLTHQDSETHHGVKFGIGKLSQPSLSASWNDSQWHHIAGTSDGSNLSLYVDGVAVATRPVTPETMPLAEGLVLYVAGSSFKAGSDRWDDLSGRNNHATKPATAEMPALFQVQNYNGKNFPAMRFNSQSGLIFPDSLNLQKPYTVIIVDRYYGTVKGRTLQSRDNNWLLGKHGGNNGCYMEGWMGAAYPATLNVFTISTATLEGTTPAWYVDGELKASSGGTTAPGKLGLCKGGRFSAEVSEADIAAILIWNRVLTPQERQTIEGWLGRQYGIAVKQTTSTAIVNRVQVGGAATDPNPPTPTQYQIADVSLWNQARSAADLQTDSRYPLTGQEIGLIGYWALDEGVGQTVFDRSPARATGAIAGAEWSIADLPFQRWLRPQRALKVALWSFLEPRRLLTTQHHVVEPDYVPVVITTTLRLQDGMNAGRVRQEAIAMVQQFFDPLNGGSEGTGYPFGRNVYLSEVYELLDSIPGVDYVEQLMLQNTPDLAAVTLHDHQLVAIQFSDAQLTLREAWE